MRSRFLHNCRRTQGAILTEVLISLVIFTLGMTAAFGLLTASVRLNSINKNRIVAVNLAQQGLEVVKNIRDGNWLVYSSKRRECWNFSPDADESGTVDATETCEIPPEAVGQNQHPIGVLPGLTTRIRTYIADFDENNRWLLLPAPQYVDTSVSPNVFTLYGPSNPNGQATSVAAVGSRQPQLYLTADGRYTHVPTGNIETLFYRVLDICYLDNVATGEDCDTSGFWPTDPTSNYTSLDNRIKVTARVYWKEKADDETFKSVTLETTLTDYLGRSEWNS